MNKGNIVLVRYKWCPISWLIRKITKSKWNHVAWALDSMHLLEARASGIRISNIRKYKNKLFYEYKILELKDISPQQLESSLQYAKTLSREGSYFGWLKSGILSLFNIEPKNIQHTCSGFIGKALESIGFHIKKHKNPSRLTPEEISRSTKTVEVKN